MLREPRPDSENIERRACYWLSVMKSDNKSSEEVREFEEWLAADMRHRIVFEEIDSMWSQIPKLQKQIDPASYRKLTLSGFINRFIPVPEILLSRSPIKAGLLNMAVVAAVCFTIITLMLRTGDIDTGSSDTGYATQTAEIKSVDLPDGSMVTIGALSAVEIHFTEAERRVELLSGEAFFSVTKDANRPFIVTTADTEIRVLGTKFDVRRSAEGVRIGVLEGRVEVVQISEQESPGAAQVRVRKVLTAKQKLYTSVETLHSEPEAITQGIPGEWRAGRLVYENATLSEVISDANRYYDGNILIDTEDLKALKVTAAFSTSQIQEMMETLSTALPVSVKRLSNGDILLRRRDQG